MKKKKSAVLRLVLGLLALLVLLELGYVIYSFAHTSHALRDAEEYRLAYPEITIVQREDGAVSLLPPDGAANGIGIVFYPGASVEPLAYVPLLSALAEEGYSVYIPQFPCGMAFLDTDAAADILAAHPETEGWYIAGHSLGGRCASQFAAANEDALRGVIVVSSAVDSALADTDLPLLMLYGDRDGIYHGVEAEDALPENTTIARIEGGNHAQFGDYGHQPMDRDATLSAEEQRALGAEAILSWLAN